MDRPRPMTAWPTPTGPPTLGDAAPWIEIDTERIVTPQRLQLRFAPGRACALEVLNISPTNAPERLTQWASSSAGAAPDRPDSLTLPLANQAVRVLRLALVASPGAPACAVAELSLEGHLRD